MLLFKMIITYKKTKIGNQIMVGFMPKIKMDNANINAAFLFELKTSFKIIKEKAITGKSGLGDCKKRKSTGKKRK